MIWIGERMEEWSALGHLAAPVAWVDEPAYVPTMADVYAGLTAPVAFPRKAGVDERVAHLVLRVDWPVALCGAEVRDHLGAKAPKRDRCVACLRIAAERGLGRPGWE